MKLAIFILILLSLGSMLHAQNAPYVYNVNGSQRTDGSKIVDIYYNILEPDGDTLLVTLQVSDDDGSTWSITPADSLLSGDIGYGILTGNDKHIIWQAGEETTDFEGSTYKFKVIADDDPNYTPFEWCDIPAGVYTYGQGDTIKTIDYNYQIMKYEVTNSEYVTYLEEALAASDIWIDEGYVVGYYEGDEHWSAGNYAFYDLGTPSSYNYARISWDGDSFIINVPSGYSPGDFDNHPVVCVSWFGAWAFAEHYGLSLPTEHEWEKAARGNTGYDYPWGNSIDGSRVNCYDSGDPFDNGTTPVGYYNGDNHSGFPTTNSPSPYGVYDMAGNVLEWTDSWWSDTSSARVFRGGCWLDSTGNLRSWFRNGYDPFHSNFVVMGFRCVRP